MELLGDAARGDPALGHGWFCCVYPPFFSRPDALPRPQGVEIGRRSRACVEAPPIAMYSQHREDSIVR